MLIVGGSHRRENLAAQAGRNIDSGAPANEYIELVEIGFKETQTAIAMERALMEGAGAVILIPYLFLRNLCGAMGRDADISLATFLIMQQVRLSANLMSLGGLAISLGMIVDAAVVQVGNVKRHLSDQNKGHAHSIDHRVPVAWRLVLEMRRPSLFGEVDHCGDLRSTSDSLGHRR